MMQGREKAKTTGTRTEALMLTVLLMLSMFLCINHSFANAQAGAVIDLFTDKEPFDGKGANQSSDAFEPQELVVLYALATYNQGPERNLPVAFEVNGPPNAYENFSTVGSGRTNDTGFADFAFRIPWPNSQSRRNHSRSVGLPSQQSTLQGHDCSGHSRCSE